MELKKMKMAIHALKLSEIEKICLYSERIHLLDGYGIGPVVYFEDIQRRFLSEMNLVLLKEF